MERLKQSREHVHTTLESKQIPKSSISLTGGELVIKPKFISAQTSLEERSKEIRKGLVKLAQSEPKRSLSGKQIASLLKDVSKEKITPREKDFNPKKKYLRAPSVAEMLKSKRLELPTGVHTIEAASSNFGPGRPIKVKTVHRSPVGKVIAETTVINIDDDTEGKRSRESTSKPLLRNSDDDDSDSSDDEFLKTFGAKRNSKRTAVEMSRAETLEINPANRHQGDTPDGKPVQLSLQSAAEVEHIIDDSKRKTKKLKTLSDRIVVEEITGIRRELPLTHSGRSVEGLRDAAALDSQTMERKTSDSQNELMELGFTKREHGDSQRDSQRNSQRDSQHSSQPDTQQDSLRNSQPDSLPDSQGDSQRDSQRVPQLSKPETTTVTRISPKQIELGGSSHRPQSSSPSRAERPEVTKGGQQTTKVPQPTGEAGKEDSKPGKVTDVKLLQQVKTQGVGTTGVIDPTTLAKNIPPQYVMVIKPNVETLLKGKGTGVADPGDKDLDIKLHDNAIKIVQRKELQPHRMISVPVGSEKFKTSEPSGTHTAKSPSTTLPPGMITVSRAGQATPITIPQPIQILSTLAGQMPRLPSPIPVNQSGVQMVPPIPKIKVMTSASLSADHPPVVVTAAAQNIKPAGQTAGHPPVVVTAAQNIKLIGQTLTTTTTTTTPGQTAGHPPVIVTAAQNIKLIGQTLTTTTTTTTPALQKARVINVAPGTMSFSQDGSAKLTYASQQYQAGQRGVVKIHPMQLMQKPGLFATKPQDLTVVNPVFSTNTKPVVPEPVSLAGQKLVRIFS